MNDFHTLEEASRYLAYKNTKFQKNLDFFIGAIPASRIRIQNIGWYRICSTVKAL